MTIDDQRRAAEAEGPADAGEPGPPSDDRVAGATSPARPAGDGKRGQFVVVGIGASAGGLDALGAVIRRAPRDGLVYVVVQHLSPHQDSALAHLLARDSRLEVVTAEDGMPLEASHVYVIPPNVDLGVTDGAIHLAPRPSEGSHVRLPIDYLFRSLADDLGSSAIGVVLSGTGSDGTLGLQAIKAAGGLTFVQDPSTTTYDGMPRSAIASGAADFVLAPEEIGRELARLAGAAGLRRAPRAREATAVPEQLSRLFALVRAELGTDLSQYKQSTIERRVERRMALHRLDRLDDYVRLVAGSVEELRALYADLLITVTRFFRDPDAFEALASAVFPHIFDRHHDGSPVRIWVPACATGEEAYSIAMSLLEYGERDGREPRIQIFATDIDDDAIQRARRGVYPATIAQDVSPERQGRFFVRKDDELHVTRRVRDLIVFSRHDLLRDAPFSRMDLVSCRNLLIYLQPPAQRKVLRLLHYALVPGGHLLLGSSETVGDAPELFSIVDRKHRIYGKKLGVGHALEIGFGDPQRVETAVRTATARPATTLQALVDRKVLDLYGPAGVVTTERLDVLQFRGHTGPYLDPVPGAASLELLKMVRLDLQLELKQAAQHAVTTRQRAVGEATIRDGDRPRPVRLEVVPLDDQETGTRCLLVTFHPLPPPREIPIVAANGEEGMAPFAGRIQELEDELARTKAHLQATMEDRESTLEELKSANEELQSSNEELQSTNEELETSKEEMQSTNEELTTVNEELQNRMAELSQVNDDLHNVLAGVDHAIVIVGMDLRIRRYTAAAEKLFNLVATDVGRSVGFLDPYFGVALEPKVSAVVHSLVTIEEEVLATNHRWYSLRIAPYKTLDHAIRGALVVVVDIDIRRRADDLAQNVSAYAGRFLRPIREPLLIVDDTLRVVWCNDAFLRGFQLAGEEVVGSLLPSIAGRQFDDRALRDRIVQIFASGAEFRDHVVPIRSDEIGARTIRIAGSAVPASGKTPLALLSLELTPAGTDGGRR